MASTSGVAGVGPALDLLPPNDAVTGRNKGTSPSKKIGKIELHTCIISGVIYKDAKFLIFKAVRLNHYALVLLTIIDH